MAERKLRASTLALNRKFTSTVSCARTKEELAALMNHAILQSPGYVCLVPGHRRCDGIGSLQRTLAANTSRSTWTRSIL